MTTTLLLLAAFLAIVVVGATLVAVYDAVEPVWATRADGTRSDQRRRAAGGRSTPACPPGTLVVAWSHLH